MLKNILIGLFLVLFASLTFNVHQAFTIGAMEQEKLKDQLKYSQDLAKMQKEAGQQTELWAERALIAEKNANEELIKINNDAIRAIRAVSGLSNSIATADKRLSDATKETCIEYATTAGELLQYLGERYRDSAAKADGHALDARRLSSAWPEESPN